MPEESERTLGLTRQGLALRFTRQGIHPPERMLRKRPKKGKGTGLPVATFYPDTKVRCPQRAKDLASRGKQYSMLVVLRTETAVVFIPGMSRIERALLLSRGNILFFKTQKQLA